MVGVEEGTEEGRKDGSVLGLIDDAEVGALLIEEGAEEGEAAAWVLLEDRRVDKEALRLVRSLRRSRTRGLEVRSVEDQFAFREIECHRRHW